VAGTTLVGQSIGMDNRAWARRAGNTILWIAAVVYICSLDIAM